MTERGPYLISIRPGPGCIQFAAIVKGTNPWLTHNMLVALLCIKHRRTELWVHCVIVQALLFSEVEKSFNFSNVKSEENEKTELQSLPKAAMTWKLDISI